jgi:predicted phosphodiesterase
MARTCVTSPERKTVIAAACKKFPRLGHRALSQKLFKASPQLFDTINAAEVAIRYHRGARGQVAAKSAKARGTFRIPPLPDSLAKPWTPFEVEQRKVLNVSDIHLPFMDKPALKAALKYGDKFKPDCILINGDLLDYQGISRFARDPRGPSVKQELDICDEFLTHLRARFRRSRIVWKKGNHEERWDKMLWARAPEILDVVEFAWEEWAGVKKNGVEVVGDQRIVMVGKLPVLHGHELPRGMTNPVNPARGAFLRTLDSVLIGHYHQHSDHTERTIHGHIIGCRATGCLCDLTPEYARINRWNHGFASIEVAKDGTYDVHLKRVIHGDVY